MVSMRKFILDLELFAFSVSVCSDMRVGNESNSKRDIGIRYYYYGGEIEPDDYPCGDENSACCPFPSFCVSNGLCFRPLLGTYERHICADPGWNSLACAGMCFEGKCHLVLLLWQSRADIEKNKMVVARLRTSVSVAFPLVMKKRIGAAKVVAIPTATRGLQVIFTRSLPKPHTRSLQHGSQPPKLKR